MSYRKGREFLIYAESNTTASTFLKVGGCRDLSWTLSNGDVDVTNKDSNGNRELLDGNFNLAVNITASGVYSDSSTVLEEIRADAEIGTHREYVVVLPDTNNNYLRATCRISSIEFTGADAEITYNLGLSGTGGMSDSTTNVTLA